MARKRHTAEEIVAKLRQVDVLMAQGRQVADAVRAIGVTEVTYYRWRNEYGGLKGDQVKRLKELGLIARMHKNAAVVALANKLARIAWAVLRHGESFSIALSTTA